MMEPFRRPTVALPETAPRSVDIEPHPARPLSAVDHAWLRMDRPTNLMMINGVLIIDGTLDPERLREVIEQRILVLPRFKQRIVQSGGRPYWEDDPDFDLDHHLHWMRLPDPGEDAQLGELVSGLVSEPLDPRRPLWSFHIVESYMGGTVFYGRIHHCIGDGVGLMFVLLSLADLVAEPRATDAQNPFTSMLRERSPALLEEACQVAEQVMPEGMRLLMASAEAYGSLSWWLKGLASTAALGRLVAILPDPKTVYRGRLQVAKQVAWTDPIDVEDVKTIGKALGGTINDVLLTAVAGAMGRYLEKRGGRRPRRLSFRAAMPVNLRAIDKMADMGNEFGLVFLSLPVGIADPVERLQELRKRAYALRKSAEPLVVYWLLKLMGMGPRWLHSLIVAIFGSKATAVMTNMPGPKQQLYLAGKPIRDFFFWVPQSGTVGLGFAICSYNGRIRIGIGTDAGLVPEPVQIVEEFHAEIEEMRRRAGA
jgi:diacylglycerol O-acyltransferase / wax synthase